MLEQPLDGIEGGFLAVLGHDRQQSTLPYAQSSGAGMQVTQRHVWKADVGSNDIHHSLVDPPPVKDAYGRKLQAFLVNL
ncbi:hypothetical protein D3C86_1085110 [compost metagenome]